MANKKISQLFENPYPRTGDIFPIVQDGVTYKVTLDNLNRLANDQYFVTHNLDPYILDDLSNRYGRYRFISGNLMISGKGTDANLPNPGSCVLRLYDGNFILNGTGIISGLNSGVTDLGHTNNTKGLYSITIGQFNVSTGTRNEIFGSRNNATGIDIKVFGDLNNVLGNNDRIFSTGNFVSGSDITIVGENNYITGTDHHVHGHNNILNSNDVKIFGNNNTGFLFSTGSFIVGKHNFVGNSTEAGANSLVYGDYNKVSGKNTLVYGRNNLIKIKSGALEKISVYGLENDVSGIEVDVYGRLNLNSGLTNQIYGHSNTGYGDINFVAGTYNKIQKPSVENHIYGDYNILTRGSGNFVVGRRNEASANTSDLVGECIFVSGTGNWVGGKDSNVTGIDIVSLGKDINITHYGNFSNVVGRGNTINGSGYYSDVYGSDNLNSGFKAIIVGKNNTNSLKSSETTIVGRINESYNEKQVIVGERNIATAPRSYTVGQNNDNFGTSGYIFGEENLIASANNNSYVIGRADVIDQNSNNNYIFGLNNSIFDLTSNNYTVGSGNDIYSNSDNNILVGYLNTADSAGDNSNIFGRNNTSTANSNSTIVGVSNTISNGTGDYIFGQRNVVGSNNPTFRASVFGSGNTIDANDSATYGYNNTVTSTSTRSHVFGLGNTSSGADAVIVGSGNRNSGVNSMVVGYGNINTSGGSNSNIFGRGNTSHATGLSVYGSGNHVTGADSATYGYGNRVSATATRSHVFGYENVSSGANNNILGSGNRVSGFDSIVVGYGNENQVNATGTDVFGRGNLLNKENTKIYGSDNKISGKTSKVYGDRNTIFDGNQTSNIDIMGDDNTVRTQSYNINIYGDNNQLNTGVSFVRINGYFNTIDSGTLNANIYGKSNTVSSTGNFVHIGDKILYDINDSYNTDNNIYGDSNLDSGYSNYIYGYNNTLNTGAAISTIFGRYNTLNSLQIFDGLGIDGTESFNNYIFGDRNLITGRETFTVGAYNTGRQNTSGYMFGRRNLMASGLTGSTIIGNEIVFPISGNAGYKLNPNNMSNAMQIGVNNSGKITILQNGNIGIGTSGTLPFENPQELLHLRSGNVLLDATEGGYFKFYDKNRYDNIPDNPSQVNQPGDIRAIVSGGNFKIDGDLVLSTGIGETGQFLAGRIFQEAFTRNLDGSMWCYTPSDLQGNCTNASANPYNNATESITGTDGINYTHKVGLWQPYGLDLGWDTIGSPTINYPSGYVSGFISPISIKDGAVAKPDFCNGDCNFDYQPHEAGRIAGRAITFLDGNPTSAIITGRYTLINTPIMKTTNLYLPPVSQNSGVLYTVKNLGQGNIMVFSTGSERIDLFFTGFMIDQRFASYEFLSNGSGWFLV